MLATLAATVHAAPKINLDQARNGTALAPVNPVVFQNGNLGSTNTHLAEGMSIPYRIVLSNLSPGAHTITIGFDVTSGGKHAIDYVTHFDRMQPHAGFSPPHVAETIDPLAGLIGTFAAPTVFPVPAPSSSGSPATGQPGTSFAALPGAQRILTMYNGAITGASYVVQGTLTDAQSETQLRIAFTAAQSTVVLAWGGHVASRMDWGEGNSAAQINGSPYHTRVIDLDGSGGAQEKSVSVAAIAVFPPPPCTLTGPEAACPGGLDRFGSAAAGSSYAWSVSGDGTLVGASTDPEAQVRAASGCGGAYTVTLRLTDTIGNSSTCSRLVPIRDTTPPVLSCPADITVECGASFDPSVTGLGTATDACDPNVTITFGDASRAPAVAAATCTPRPPIVRTWTVTDACGNTSTCVQTITFVDTTPPALTCPPDATVECGAPSDPSHTGFATAHDACDPSVTITFGDAGRSPPFAVASCTPGAPIVRTWTATDACGNTSTCVQNISFVDTTPPVLTCPPDASVSCGSPVDPSVTGMATAHDGCDPNVTITFGDASRGPALASLACPPKTPIVRTWTATDACGNTSTCVQNISFVDTTPPVIECPADVTIECGAATDPAHTGTAVARDNCDPNVTITFGDAGRTPALALASCTPRPPIERTWTATDACGNVSTCIQIITFVDTTPPALTCPTDATVSCGAPFDPSATGTATALDGCDPNVTITFGDASRGPTLLTACTPKAPIARTWTATDACGNTSTCVQNIVFVDTTPPAIECPPDVTIECGAPTDPAHTGVPVARDDCDPSVTITFGDAGRAPALAAAACTPRPPIVRTWTATDACGNASTCVQTIAFVDTKPPVLVCPADLTVECGTSIDPKVTGMATSHDDCDPNVTITFGDAGRGPALRSGASLETACAGDVLDRTWSATDDCGNTTTCVQHLTFVDHTAPSITCPANVTQPACDPVVTWEAKATDGCDPAPALVFAPPSGSTFPLGVTTVQGTATDACGNVSRCSFSVTIGSAASPVCAGACPRTAGFWYAQCDQAPTGQTKFDATQMAAIASRADDKASIFSWPTGSDFARFCDAVVSGHMDVRRQAQRQFATLLANVSVGELGLVGANGDVVQLDVSTLIVCDGLASTTVGALIVEVDAILVALEGQSLSGGTVKTRYAQIITCLDDINNGRGLSNLCATASVENALYRDPAGTLDAPGEAVAAHRATPNPFRTATRIGFDVPSGGGDAFVAVFDVAGRAVRRLASGPAFAGTHEITWDGRDESGTRVTSGVYFVRIVTAAHSRTMPVVVLDR